MITTFLYPSLHLASPAAHCHHHNHFLRKKEEAGSGSWAYYADQPIYRVKTGEAGKKGLHLREKKGVMREENTQMQEGPEKANGVNSHLGSILRRHFHE